MKKLGKLLRNMLLVCGVLFIIVLLLPDDEEMSANQEQSWNIRDRSRST